MGLFRLIRTYFHFIRRENTMQWISVRTVSQICPVLSFLKTQIQYLSFIWIGTKSTRRHILNINCRWDHSVHIAKITENQKRPSTPNTATKQQMSKVEFKKKYINYIGLSHSYNNFLSQHYAISHCRPF